MKVKNTARKQQQQHEQQKNEELTLDGKIFNTYEEYVMAKRRRNMEMLQKSGLLEAKQAISSSMEKSKASTRGIKRIKRVDNAVTTPTTRRKSSRLAGKVAENIYIERETTGGIEVAGSDIVKNEVKEEDNKERFYDNRINDGSDLSLNEAASFPKAKWLSDTAVDDAVTMIKGIAPSCNTEPKHEENYKRSKSPDSVIQNNDLSFLREKINELQINDMKSVAKVTPERIYSVCFHPTKTKLIGCAGDKVGNIGIWNINGEGHTDGVSLFKPHTSAVSNLQWNENGTSLYSLSYDSTIRELDIETQSFKTMFATYDSSDIYKNQPGYNMDSYKHWLQYGCLDHTEQGYMVSTSFGDVFHLDLRSREITFNYELDEKKINTISLHPNGYSLITGGLSRKIQLFDIRNLSKKKKCIASQTFGKSVNSAFFSPSGKFCVATTMADFLEIYENFHLENDKHGLIPHRTIKHDNRTGRWLTTFQATWHPRLDTFVVGSMAQPRSIEIFNSDGILRSIRGFGLVSVASRCCFHPCSEELMVLGGNSSGRMYLLKK